MIGDKDLMICNSFLGVKVFACFASLCAIVVILSCRIESRWDQLVELPRDDNATDPSCLRLLLIEVNRARCHFGVITGSALNCR